MRFPRLTLILALSAASLAAQSASKPRHSTARIPELNYVPDLTIDLPKFGIARAGFFTVNHRGSMVVAADRYMGVLSAFDSLGNKLPWSMKIGRGNDSEIGWIFRAGWVGRGDSMWIDDGLYQQLAVVDGNGKVVSSFERPSWVRPFWRDRRKYPLFSSMSWEAIYPDGTMLVLPFRPRALFDTPEYDRSMQYLVRVNSDGKILRTVARVPISDARVSLRDGMQRSYADIPFYAPTFWRTSDDGERVAVLTPLTTASDSGAFRLTMLNENGDTVFSRRYVTEASRVPTSVVEAKLAEMKPFGRYSAQWISDTVRKLIPVFESRVLGITIGVDHSVWVWVRSDKPQTRAMVIDPRGDVVGMATFPPNRRSSQVSVDHVWQIQRNQPRKGGPTLAVVRLKRLPATTAPRARTATASASPRPARPPR
jgi:hypothetical protein